MPAREWAGINNLNYNTMYKATVKLMLDGRAMSNGLHPIYLRIIKDRKKKNISLGLQCQKSHFQNEAFVKQHPRQQIENETLLSFKARALKIIREMQLTQGDFTLKEFEDAFRGKSQNRNLKVLNFFNEIIEEQTRAGKIGNAKAYKDTRDSVIKFAGNSIKFSDITPTFLDKYEISLRELGNKNGGIAFKMRELRALFNKARKRKLIPKEPYPFDDYKISKLRLQPHKIALTVDEFKRFRDVDLSNHPNLLDSHRYFLFSVYARGCNFHDMALLRWSNLKNGRIHYARSKTGGLLNLEIIPQVQVILDYYKAQKRDTGYVFPILLQEGLTPQQIAYRKHKTISRYNAELKEIAELANIDKNMSSYVARHSFATILKMLGTPIEKISEMMGHTDVSITIAYLKEFSNEDLDEENRKFTDL